MFDFILLADQSKWNIPILVTLICTGILHLFLVIQNSTERKYKKVFFFLLSLGLFYLMTGSPLSTISHLSISLHMLKLSILYFIVPPLLLLGIPQLTLQKIGHFPQRNWIIRISFHPFFAVSIFSFLLFIYHLPTVLNFFSHHPSIHQFFIALLFVFALGMWLPIVMQHEIKRYAHWHSILLLPACTLMIVYACLGGITNPFLSKITVHLCLPPQSSSFAVLPPPFNTRFDQFIASFLMFGVHKFSLIVTIRLRSDMRQFFKKTNLGLASEFSKS